MYVVDILFHMHIRDKRNGKDVMRCSRSCDGVAEKCRGIKNFQVNLSQLQGEGTCRCGSSAGSSQWKAVVGVLAPRRYDDTPRISQDK